VPTVSGDVAQLGHDFLYDKGLRAEVLMQREEEVYIEEAAERACIEQDLAHLVREVHQ
jgi:hypothetical protein